MSQPPKLVGVAQLIGLDDLIGGHAEGAVDRVLVRSAARLIAGATGAAGIVVAGARHHLAIGFGGAVVLGIRLRTIGGIAIRRGLRPGGGTFAAVGLVLAVLFLALALIVVGGGIVDLPKIDIQILNQPAADAGIGILIDDIAFELGDVLGDLAFEPRPPEIDDPPR